MERSIIAAEFGVDNFTVTILMRHIVDFWHFFEQLPGICSSLQNAHLNLLSPAQAVRDMLNVPRYDQLPRSNNAVVATHLCQLPQDMGTDDNGFTNTLQGAQSFPKLHPASRIEPRGPRIKQQDLGRV